MIELEGRYWANENGWDGLNNDMVAGGVKGSIVVRFTRNGRITKLNTTFITIPAEVVIRIKLLSNGRNEVRGSSSRPSQTRGWCLICDRRVPPRSGRSRWSGGRDGRASRRGDPDELEIKLSKQGASCRHVFIFVPMADWAKTISGKGLLPTFALGLLANLKETRKVKGACQVEATSITTVLKE